MCFDKVNEAHIGCKIMVLLRVEECFQGEEAISAAKSGGATELELRPMFVK